jgi:hypothetical protein
VVVGANGEADLVVGDPAEASRDRLLNFSVLLVNARGVEAYISPVGL